MESMTTMKTSPNGRAFITGHEGEVLKVYSDPVGVKTAGVGRTGPEVDALPLGSKITKKQSQKWLDEDLRETEGTVNRHVKVSLTPSQFDSLVSLCFNIGEGNFKSSTLLKKLNAGDYQGAASEFSRWVYAKKKKLPGLVRRRMEEQAMFLKGIPQEAELETNVECDQPEPAPSALNNRGVQAAGAATTAAVLSEQAEKVSMLAPYSDYLMLVFVALTVLALVYALKGRK
jgi:lysozyme